MSLIDRLAAARQRGEDGLLRAFWWSTVVPTSKLLRATGKTYLRGGFDDPQETSTWEVPERRVMKPEDFETGY